MRWFHTTVVAVLAIIVLAFAVQNFQSTTISLFNIKMSAPLAVVVAVVYLLGMLTGWKRRVAVPVGRVGCGEAA